jgi:hypothetical protein
MDELTHIYSTSGSYSIFAIGLFETVESINDFVNNSLGKLDILDFSVDVVTKKIKDSPFLV